VFYLSDPILLLSFCISSSRSKVVSVCDALDWSQVDPVRKRAVRKKGAQNICHGAFTPKLRQPPAKDKQGDQRAVSTTRVFGRVFLRAMRTNRRTIPCTICCTRWLTIKCSTYFSWYVLTSSCNWFPKDNRTPKPFVCKSCTESYDDSYAVSYLCRQDRPFHLTYKLPQI
jgi:hypothetical protein